MNDMPEEVLFFNRNTGAAVAADPAIDLGVIQIFFEVCHLAFSNPHVAVPEHQHPHFQLALPVRGAMKVSCDTICKQLDSNMGKIAILPPFTLHRFNFDSDEQTFYVSVALSMKPANPLHGKLLEKIAKQIEEESFIFSFSESQKSLFAEAVKREKNETLWYTKISAMKLKLLISEIFSFFLERSNISSDKEMSECDLDRIALIRHRLANRLNSRKPPLAYVAKCCDLSPRHVNRIFKAATGKTVNAYWLERKLELMDQLLISTDMPIGDVAHTLGFHKQSLFSDFCQRHFGQSPSEYRKNKRDVLKHETMS